MLDLKVVQIEIPEGANVIVGQSHFIKTIEDLYETLVESGPTLKFGVAFCEASSKKLVRSDGNDSVLIKHAEKEALKISAGHVFIIFLKEGYPVNVLNRIRNVSELVNIFAATSNPLQIVIAETEQGRGILGVIDGGKSLGIENESDRAERKNFIRKIGYKR
jgi:hypothetical protein